MTNNLIICATPFQVLVAEQIIRHFAGETFYGVMLMSADNPKFRYYGKRLIQACGGRGQLYLQQKSRAKILALWDLLALKRQGKKLGRVDKLFLSSLDSVVVQTFISGLDFSELYTFDDGTANLVADSHYYTHDRHQSLPFRLLKTCLGNPHTLASLKAQSRLHFTVYRQKNVFAHTRYLPILPANRAAGSGVAQSEERILLGQPIYEMQPGLSPAAARAANTALAERMVRELGINAYLPHPRETYKISGVAYLETELVAEDFFARHLADKQSYTLYTYCSGAVIPFIGAAGIRVVCLRPHNCPSALVSSYELLEQMGAEIQECAGV